MFDVRGGALVGPRFGGPPALRPGGPAGPACREVVEVREGALRVDEVDAFEGNGAALRLSSESRKLFVFFIIVIKEVIVVVLIVLVLVFPHHAHDDQTDEYQAEPACANNHHDGARIHAKQTLLPIACKRHIGAPVVISIHAFWLIRTVVPIVLHVVVVGVEF